MSTTTATICAPCLRGRHDACTTGDRCGCEACNPPAVVWEEPPETRGTRSSTPPLTPEQERELRAHPKRWARIRTWPKPTSAASCATRIKKGQTALDATQWEAAARKTEGGGSVLYLRFVGSRSS